MNGHAFLPKDVKNISFKRASCYKIPGIGACSESLQVCKTEGCSSAAATFRKLRGLV